MIKPIMKDVFFLNQKSDPATEADRQVAEDLLDTLKAHEAGCVGMAANMIGVRKNIIAVNMGFVNVVMYNPKILKKTGAYETEESCLSLEGVRKCTRYREIELEYQDSTGISMETIFGLCGFKEAEYKKVVRGHYEGSQRKTGNERQRGC